MTAPTVFGTDPSARVARFARHWNLPQDADSYRLLSARLGPAVSRRRLAVILAVALACLLVYGWAAFSDSVPLRFIAAVGLSLVVAAASLGKALADARRDATLSLSLPRHVTRSRPLRVADLLGHRETRLLLAVFGIACTAFLAAAATHPELRGLEVGMAVVELALAAVTCAVLRVIASRPTVAENADGLQVDLALRRNRAGMAQSVAVYCGFLPTFTTSAISSVHPSSDLAVAGLALGSVGCYFVLAIRLYLRHDGLLAEERTVTR